MLSPQALTTHPDLRLVCSRACAAPYPCKPYWRSPWPGFQPDGEVIPISSLPHHLAQGISLRNGPTTCTYLRFTFSHFSVMSPMPSAELALTPALAGRELYHSALPVPLLWGLQYLYFEQRFHPSPPSQVASVSPEARWMSPRGALSGLRGDLDLRPAIARERLRRIPGCPGIPHSSAVCWPGEPTRRQAPRSNDL